MHSTSCYRQSVFGGHSLCSAAGYSGCDSAWTPPAWLDSRLPQLGARGHASRVRTVLCVGGAHVGISGDDGRAVSYMQTPSPRGYTCPTSFWCQHTRVAWCPARCLLGTCLAGFSTGYNFQPIPWNVVPVASELDAELRFFSKCPPTRSSSSKSNRKR
jgi:hypothetical protein